MRPSRPLFSPVASGTDRNLFTSSSLAVVFQNSRLRLNASASSAKSRCMSTSTRECTRGSRSRPHGAPARVLWQVHA
eukprot:6205772-Pleurochrysis_carterae.AAC.3